MKNGISMKLKKLDPKKNPSAPPNETIENNNIFLDQSHFDYLNSPINSSISNQIVSSILIFGATSVILAKRENSPKD